MEKPPAISYRLQAKNMDAIIIQDSGRKGKGKAFFCEKKRDKKEKEKIQKSVGVTMMCDR